MGLRYCLSLYCTGQKSQCTKDVQTCLLHGNDDTSFEISEGFGISLLAQSRCLMAKANKISLHFDRIELATTQLQCKFLCQELQDELIGAFKISAALHWIALLRIPLPVSLVA